MDLNDFYAKLEVTCKDGKKGRIGTHIRDFGTHCRLNLRKSDPSLFVALFRKSRALPFEMVGLTQDLWLREASLGGAWGGLKIISGPPAEF